MLLNCDMGESFGVWKMGVDELLMPHIDLANIACGGHASDPDVMSATLQLAKQHQVSVGAHPSYADIAGFGRRTIPYQAEQLSRLIVTQVGALAALADYHQVSLDYVKPHGALYNDMHQDLGIFEAVCKAVAGFKRPLKLMVHASQCSQSVSACNVNWLPSAQVTLAQSSSCCTCANTCCCSDNTAPLWLRACN